jgi:hypothetical protein
MISSCGRFSKRDFESYGGFWSYGWLLEMIWRVAEDLELLKVFRNDLENCRGCKNSR